MYLFLGFIPELEHRSFAFVKKESYDLRHTNATLMLKSNIPAKIAAERLGHSTIGITFDLYSHVLKDMQEEAVNKLDKMIFNN